jgi:hypothetical protein
MKRYDVTITPVFLLVLSAWLMTMTSLEFGTDRNVISPVFASTNRSIILITDLHLEECIKQLQLGNTEDALNHCELADHELGMLLNSTADK